MAFFPRFMAHEFAPMFRLMDDYATQAISRNNGAGHNIFSPAFNLNNTLRTFEPRFDVKENREAYELQGELPGIEQKDLTLEFTDANTLSIRGRSETVREEGTRPGAAIEAAQSEQQKIGDSTETESSGSNGYHKATVEDEGAGNATTNDNTVATTSTEGSEVAQARKHDAPKYWVSERSVGSFARSFSFPTRVDQDAVKASLKNGILSIVVPKAVAPANRKINIE